MPGTGTTIAGAAAATTAEVSSRPQRKARRVRPRSHPPPPPPPPPPPFRATNGVSGVHRIAGRKTSPEEAGALPTCLFLSLLVVSAGAAPAAALAAAASSSTSSSPFSRFPFSSATPTSNAAATAAATAVATAFCFPPPSTRRVDSCESGGPRPSVARRLRRHSTNSSASAAASPATGRSRASNVRCAASAASPSLSRPSQRRRRTGEWVRGWKRWCDGGGGGNGRAPLLRVSSTVGSGYTDEWGGGGNTEETSLRPGDGRAAAAAAGPFEEWGEDTELLSSFGFSGDLSEGDGLREDGGGGGGTAMGAASPLSERDVARLEEVGIMVKELEADDNVEGGDDGDGLSSSFSAPVAGMSSPGSRLPGEDYEEDVDGGMASLAASSSAEEEETAAARRSEFVGGVAMSSSRLRMTCGDPVFFGQLAELMQGLHRRSGGRKFLTHAEEMELGVKVQRYRRLIEVQEQAEKDSGRRPPLREVARSAVGGQLSDEEFAHVMQDGMEARQRLVVCNLALVVSLSNKYKRSHFSCNCLQTLIQEGTIGLIRAAERYDPDKGFRFTTYAIWWIEARLRVSVQTEERMIHVPMWVKNKYNVVSRSIPKLRQALDREPTSEEIAAQVAVDTDSKVVLTPKRVQELQTWVAFHRKHESLDMPLDMGTSLPLECATIEDGVKAPEPSLESTSELEIQRDFLESDLSKIQRKILRMKVGLGGEKGKNRQEISRALKMPFNNVISEERKAFYKLRGLQRGGGYPSFEELK